MSKSTPHKSFQTWWDEEGSVMSPNTPTERRCRVAWKNGAYEANLKVEALKKQNAELLSALDEFVKDVGEGSIQIVQGFNTAFKIALNAREGAE